MEKYEAKHMRTYKQERKRISDSLTQNNKQFKKDRTDTKVTKMMQTIDNAPVEKITSVKEAKL